MKLMTCTPTPCLFLRKWPLIPGQLPGLMDSRKEPYMQGGKYLRPIHGRMYFCSFITNATGGGFLWSILPATLGVCKLHPPKCLAGPRDHHPGAGLVGPS